MPNAVPAGILFIFWGVVEILKLGSIEALRPPVSSLEDDDVFGPGEENTQLAWKRRRCTHVLRRPHNAAHDTLIYAHWLTFLLFSVCLYSLCYCRCICLFIVKICLWQCVHKTVWLFFCVWFYNVCWYNPMVLVYFNGLNFSSWCFYQLLDVFNTSRIVFKAITFVCHVWS